MWMRINCCGHCCGRRGWISSAMSNKSKSSHQAGNKRLGAVAAHQALELFANRGFDFAAEHHGCERQVAFDIQLFFADRDTAFQGDAERLEREAERVAVPVLLEVTYGVLKFGAEDVDKTVEPR